MSPVATPLTEPSSLNSTSAAAKPGKISTPSSSACAAEPARQIAEAGAVGALVVHERRHQECGNRELALLRQHPVEVVGHRHGQRRALVPPVGDQLVERARIDHRARQDMRADLAAFFEHADADLAALLGAKLLEADRRRQAGDAGADDDDIIFHRFAVAHSIHLVARCHRFGQHSPANSLTAPSTLVDGWRMGGTDGMTGEDRSRAARCRRLAGGSTPGSMSRSARRRATGAAPRRRRRAAPPRRSPTAPRRAPARPCRLPRLARRRAGASARPPRRAARPAARRRGRAADADGRFPVAAGMRRGPAAGGRVLGAGAAHARRDRDRPRRGLSRHAGLLPRARRAARRRRARALRRASRATISASPGPSACCCSATPRRAP